MHGEVRLQWPGRVLRGLVLGCLLLALTSWVSAAQQAASPPEKRLGILEPGDLYGAISQFERLAAFYGAITERDSNRFASQRWAELQANYLDVARQLSGLLSDGRLSIVDLPEGSLRVFPDGRIELDERLDGRWLPSLLRSNRTPRESATGQDNLLLPVLIRALSQTNSPDDWPWFDDHVRRAGTLGPLAADEAVRAELAQYFFLKDRYLALSMRRIAEGNPLLRHDWARRQMRAFTDVRGLRRNFIQRFGAGPAELLRRDWSDYVALVDGFALTRGWLMLDPTLRLTQMRRPLLPGEVERAADEIVSEQDTSILARRAGQRPPGLSGDSLTAVTPPASDAAEPASVARGPAPDLASLIQRARTAEAQAALQDEVAKSLPLQALLLKPELRASPSQTAEFRAFATRLKEAIRRPDPKLEIAKRDAALGAAEKQLAALQGRVKELEPVEQEVAALQVQVQSLHQAEQKVAALQERVQELNAAEQEVAALQERVQELNTAEQEVAALQERVQELNAAEQEVAALQERVQELNAAEQEVAALQERVQELNAAEQEVAALQERVQELNAAEQEVAALQERVQELNTAEQEVAALQERVQELNTAEQEVAALQERVQELNTAEQEVAALQERVQELNAAEQEVTALQDRVQVLGAAEQEVAALRQQVQALNQAKRDVAALEEQVNELGSAQGQVATLQEQVDQLGSALSTREQEATVLQEQLAEVRDGPTKTIVPTISRIEERQLYMMAAIALMFLLTLALWLWRRESPAVVYEQLAEPARVMPPPLALKSPAARAGPRTGPAPLPDVIEVPPLSTPTEGAEARQNGRVEAAKPDGAPKTSSQRSDANGHEAGSNETREEVEKETSWQQTAAAIRAAALGDEESPAVHPIVRALRKGNLPLFELLFSELTELRSPQLQRIVYGGGGEDLAIVCRAVGVDRLLFGTIFLLTDQLRGGDAESDPERLGAIISMYDRTAPETASKVLLKWQRNWGAELTVDSSLVE